MDDVGLFVKGHCGGDLGAWAYVLALENRDTHKSHFGTKENTTHNAMEVEACIHGLLALKRPCHVTITTNSMYLKGGIALLLEGKNYDTNVFSWQRFLVAAQSHTIDCVHILKAQNSGYMRLADSLALNLLPIQYRRGA